jgi:hypothetical protein
MTIIGFAISTIQNYLTYKLHAYIDPFITNGAISLLKSYNFTTTEKHLTEVAEISEKFFPNGKAHSAIEKFLAIENAGGIKNLAQAKLNKCADSAGMKIEEVSKIANCLEVTFIGKSDDLNKVVTFTNCYPMTPFDAFEIMEQASVLTQCLGQNLAIINSEL